MTWSCPACGREFLGRRAHTCAPAMSEATYFAGRPPHERAIFEAVRDHLQSLGPVIVEFVNVGIFFKTKRNVVELRPRTRWVNLGFGLGRWMEHPRITRTTKTQGPQTYYGVRIASPEDVDEQVRDWMTESYFESGI